MLKKQQYKEQRDNLGAHLKNTVNKVYQITDGISQVCKLARKGRLGKGKAFKEIEKLASELRNFNDVPANMAYKFSPTGDWEDSKTWEHEKESNPKFILNKEQADNSIYPTINDFKKIVENYKGN